MKRVLLLLVDYLTWRIENPTLDNPAMKIAAHARVGKIRDLLSKL